MIRITETVQQNSMTCETIVNTLCYQQMGSSDSKTAIWRNSNNNELIVVDTLKSYADQ